MTDTALRAEAQSADNTHMVFANEEHEKAGITGVTATVGELTKTEATTSAAGSLSINVSIACGSKSDTVTVSKTIPQLPLSETDKVKAAKTVVENALKEIEAANGTTKAELQNAIDKIVFRRTVQRDSGNNLECLIAGLENGQIGPEMV